MAEVPAVAILISEPVLGVVVGLFLGALVLPKDPAPGDGFLLMIWAFASFGFSIPSSVLLLRNPNP